jgi:hypothetical protein
MSVRQSARNCCKRQAAKSEISSGRSASGDAWFGTGVLWGKTPNADAINTQNDQSQIPKASSKNTSEPSF